MHCNIRDVSRRINKTEKETCLPQHTLTYIMQPHGCCVLPNDDASLCLFHASMLPRRCFHSRERDIERDRERERERVLT